MKYYEFVNHNIDNWTSSIMIKEKEKRKDFKDEWYVD